MRRQPHQPELRSDRGALRRPQGSSTSQFRDLGRGRFREGLRLQGGQGRPADLFAQATKGIIVNNQIIAKYFCCNLIRQSILEHTSALTPDRHLRVNHPRALRPGIVRQRHRPPSPPKAGAVQPGSRPRLSAGQRERGGLETGRVQSQLGISRQEHDRDRVGQTIRGEPGLL